MKINYRPFFVVSAFKGELTRATNLRRSKRLREFLTNHGFAFKELEGKYLGQLEDSFAVFGNSSPEFLRLGLQLGEEWGQEAILFVDNIRAVFFHEISGTVTRLGKWQTFTGDVSQLINYSIDKVTKTCYVCEESHTV